MRYGKKAVLMAVLTGVFSATAVAEVTVEERIRAYEKSPDAAQATLIMNAISDPAEKVAWGKRAYAETPHEVLALRVVRTQVLDLEDYEDAVKDGKAYYEQTPAGGVAQMVVSALLHLNREDEALQYAQDAYEETPYDALAAPAVTILTRRRRYEDAATFGAAAYAQTPGERLAGNTLIPMRTAVDYEDMVAFARRAYAQTPGDFLAGSTYYSLREEDRKVVLSEMILDAYTGRLGGLVYKYHDALPDAIASVYVEDAPGVLWDALVAGETTVGADAFAALVEAVDPGTEEAIADLLAAGEHAADPEPGYRAAVAANIARIEESFPGAAAFQASMDALVEPVLRLCSATYRLETYEGLLAILPLDGDFDDWTSVLRRYSWRVEQLGKTVE